MLSNQEVTSPEGSRSVWWHALYTRHQHEKVVAQALLSKGFDVFLPQYRAVHRWKDRQKEVMLPLFPNYVFIYGGLERMLNIVTTPGVHSLVTWGARPAEIPTEEIEAVRRLVNSPFEIEPHPVSEMWRSRPGQIRSSGRNSGNSRSQDARSAIGPLGGNALRSPPPLKWTSRL